MTRLRSALGVVGVVALLAAAPAPADHSQLDVVGVGPLGGNADLNALYLDSSRDGQHAFFITAEKLTADDTDPGTRDVYDRSGTTTRLISTGPDPGIGAGVEPQLKAVSEDGAYAYFETSEPLVSADGDSAVDVYLRHGNTTDLVSTGPGTSSEPATLRAISADGTHAVFDTREQLLPSDTDSARDLYVRSAGVTSLVSGGAADTTANTGTFVTVALDGARIQFVSGLDVWEWSAGNVSLVSQGCVQWCGHAVALRGASRDGTHVFVETLESYVAADDDPCQEDSEENPLGCPDIYDFSGGVPTLITPGTQNSFTPPSYVDSADDGDPVLFMSAEGLEPGTFEECEDLYVREGDSRTVISAMGSFASCGAAFPYGDMSPSGAHVLFGSDGQLAPSDTDLEEDVYIWSRTGELEHVSTGPVGGNGQFFDVPGTQEMSDDGRRVVFQTSERLVPADTDTSADVYERFGGITYLLSVGPTGGNASFDATLEGQSADGSRVFFQTAERLAAADTDNTHDVYAATVAPGYPRPRAATPTLVPLVPAFRACTAPDRQHAPPLAHDSCSSPDQASTHLTVGTPDANGQPAKSVGSARYGAARGDPGTAADEADVRFYLRLGDVRRASDLSDYVGELELGTEIRFTDRRSGPGADEPATVEEFDFPVAVPCAATADATIGALCEIATTAEASMPGAVTEGARAIWELGQISVYDGGPDGLAATEDNALFAVQGVFVP